MRPPTTSAVQKALDVLLKSIKGNDTPDFTFDVPSITDVKTIDQDVGGILLAVQTLTSSAMNWVAKVNMRRNTLVTFSSLPPELATSIFEHTLDGSVGPGSRRGSLHSLAKVSVHWRRKVLQSPSLWTSIEIDDGLEWVKLSLRKSLGARLDIRAPGRSARLVDGPPFIEAVARHTHRWRSLEICLQNYTKDILLHLKHSLPSINAIRMSSSMTNRSIEISGGPNLRELNLEGVQPLRWDFGYLSSLHHLAISNTGDPIPQISTILSALTSCRDLQTLSLRSLQESSETNPSSSSLIQPFPKLLSLRLQDLSSTATSRIIHFIDAPNLQTLHIKSRTREGSVSISVWEALLDATGKDVSVMAALLQHLPPLENIFIKAQDDSWFDVHSPHTGVRLSVQIYGQHVTQGLVNSAPKVPSANVRSPVYLSCNGANPMLDAAFLNRFPTMARLTINGEEQEILRVMEVLGEAVEIEDGRQLDPSGLSIHWVIPDRFRTIDSMRSAMMRLDGRRAEMIAAGRPAPALKGV